MRSVTPTMYRHGILCLQLSFIILDNLEVSGRSLGVHDFFTRYFISGDSYGGFSRSAAQVSAFARGSERMCWYNSLFPLKFSTELLFNDIKLLPKSGVRSIILESGLQC